LVGFVLFGDATPFLKGLHDRPVYTTGAFLVGFVFMENKYRETSLKY